MEKNAPTTGISVEEEAKKWVNSHQPFLDLLKNSLPLKAGIMAYRDGYNSRDEEVAELVKALEPLGIMANAVFLDTNPMRTGVLYAFNRAELTYETLRNIQSILNKYQTTQQ